ncbi:MAG: FkbM family methyltransferase [Planctomycetota bacterium]|nr:FkbM family methyltransferase [Planctomycetota bacterium]
MLFKFTHGLGDAVQFTCVLQHLRRYFPEWQVDVWSLQGKHSAFHGQCHRSLHDRQPEPDARQYHAALDVGWHEAEQGYAGVPSTKVSRFLMEEFGIEPDPELYRYRIEIGPEARQAATRYLSEVVKAVGKHPPDSVVDAEGKPARYPVLLLHYQGNTSQSHKDLSHETARAICNAAMGAGLVPVILDWDRRSPLPDQSTIFCPIADNPLWNHTGTGDAERLAALIEQSAVMVGVDSGPLHVAGATSTPTLAVWTQHFPAKYFDLADNITHLIPEGWRGLPLASNPSVAEFFLRSYRYQVYREIDPAIIDAILARVQGVVTGGVVPPDPSLLRYGEFWIRKDNVAQDLVIVGDIFERDAYKTELLSNNAGPQEVVVDIGAHIGTFACKWHQKNPLAKIICVEACPENLAALRANVGDFATVVHAACTYESGRMALLNAVRPNCESTGGSVVVPAEELATTSLKPEGYKYWEDVRELPTVTLEQLLKQLNVDHIDILKLDCEGSEYSILGNTPSLGKIRYIVGEYHQRGKWDAFRSQRLPDWDYGQMLDGGENGGLFHYANPRPPVVTAPVAAEDVRPEVVEFPVVPEPVPASDGRCDTPAPLDERTAEFIKTLFASLEPTDQYLWSEWRTYYQTLFEIAARLQAKTVVEIGTRAGYSALTFLAAVPGASVTSYDAAAEPDSLRLLAHAERLLSVRNCRLIRADSQGLDRLPIAELVYVDGDHTFAGCLNDLKLAARASDTLLVDDFGTHPGVRQAVETFLSAEPGFFHSETIPFAFGGALGTGGFVLLTRNRRPKPAQPLISPPLLRVAVPAGIGDAVWALAKIPHMLRVYGADQVHIGLCGSPPYRSLPFVERFDFVASAEYSRWQCVEADPYTAEGVYNWASSGVGWHYEYDWMLQANRHLETGQRLETWLPEYDTDWNIADRFRFLASELRYAREFEAKHGPYCIFYLGPEAGNSGIAGHNRGELWTPAEWGRLASHCRGLGLKIVVVGARYDRSYLERHVAPHLGEYVDCVGSWGIGQSFAVIQRSRFVIAYQSGVGIFSVYLGVPAACFWRPHGDSIDPHGYVTFSEQMASAWAPPEALAAGRYLPLIYTKCSPESIAEHIEHHRWHTTANL